MGLQIFSLYLRTFVSISDISICSGFDEGPQEHMDVTRVHCGCFCTLESLYFLHERREVALARLRSNRSTNIALWAISHNEKKQVFFGKFHDVLKQYLDISPMCRGYFWVPHVPCVLQQRRKVACPFLFCSTGSGKSEKSLI